MMMLFYAKLRLSFQRYQLTKVFEYIKAGLILRENKRYYLNLPFLESAKSLALDQEVFVRNDSHVYQEILDKHFQTELRNQTNAAILESTPILQGKR